MNLTSYIEYLEHALISVLEERRINGFNDAIRCVATDHSSFTKSDFSENCIRESIDKQRNGGDGSIYFGYYVMPPRKVMFKEA